VGLVGPVGLVGLVGPVEQAAHHRLPQAQAEQEVLAVLEVRAAQAVPVAVLTSCGATGCS
jgi:hypothetical protein